MYASLEGQAQEKMSPRQFSSSDTIMGIRSSPRDRKEKSVPQVQGIQSFASYQSLAKKEHSPFHRLAISEIGSDKIAVLLAGEKPGIAT